MPTKPTTAVAPATTPATAYRRSRRLAAKPTVRYAELAETPDELLMERTKAMYEVFLEERLAAATRDIYGVYWRSRKDFLKLYEDLPEDDIERIAAESLVNSLHYPLHPLVTKYQQILTDKKRKEKGELATAKVLVSEGLYKKAIETYNEVLVFKTKLEEVERSLEKYVDEIKSALRSEPIQVANDMKCVIWNYAEKKFRALRADKRASTHATGFLTAIRTGKFPKASHGYK